MREEFLVLFLRGWSTHCMKSGEQAAPGMLSHQPLFALRKLMEQQEPKSLEPLFWLEANIPSRQLPMASTGRQLLWTRVLI